MAEILSIGELLDLGGSASTAGLIPYSALEYSAQKITAISGTAIGGNVDSATVTAIVSSAVSGKADQSALDQCCSSMSSVVSSLETSVTSMSSVVSGLTGDYLEKSASSMFQPSGDYAYQSSLSSYMPGSASSQFAPSGDYAYNSALSAYQPSGDYAYNSALSSKLDESAFTAYTATAAGHTYTGVDPVVVDNENDRISLSATPVQLDGTMTSYMSGGTGFVGVNGNITSQMTSFVKTGDMSGYIPTSESAKYQLTANMSSYATTAQLSGKLDSSAQVVTSVGMLDNEVRYINGKNINAGKASVANSAYKYIYPRDNLGYLSSEDISALRNSAQHLYSAKLDASANLVSSLGTTSVDGHTYISKINSLEISAKSATRAVRAGTANFAETAGYAKSAFIEQGVYVPFTAYAMNSSLSSKLDASATSDFLAASASSGFMAASASSDFYGTGNPSGFTNYLPNFGYNADDEISSIDGSAVAGGWNYTSPSGTVAIDNISGTIENTNSALRVEEHVTAATNVASASASSDNPWNFMLSTGPITVPDNTILSFPSVYCYPPNTRSADPSQFGWLELRAYDENDQEVRSASSKSSVRINQLSSISIPLTGYNKFSVYYITNVGYFDVSSASAVVSFDVPGQTASSTSVKTMAWSDMSNVSAWQSLTAWAVSQGWNP